MRKHTTKVVGFHMHRPQMPSLCMIAWSVRHLQPLRNAVLWTYVRCRSVWHQTSTTGCLPFWWKRTVDLKLRLEFVQWLQDPVAVLNERGVVKDQKKSTNDKVVPHLPDSSVDPSPWPFTPRGSWALFAPFTAWADAWKTSCICWAPSSLHFEQFLIIFLGIVDICFLAPWINRWWIQHTWKTSFMVRCYILYDYIYI